MVVRRLSAAQLAPKADRTHLYTKACLMLFRKAPLMISTFFLDLNNCTVNDWSVVILAVNNFQIVAIFRLKRCNAIRDGLSLADQFTVFQMSQLLGTGCASLSFLRNNLMAFRVTSA